MSAINGTQQTKEEKLKKERHDALRLTKPLDPKRFNHCSPQHL